MVRNLDDKKPDAKKPSEKKPRRPRVPFASRALKPGAGLVNPHERPAVSARTWPKWSPLEAHQQGQQELFAAPTSVDPQAVEAKRLRKRRKRQAQQPGVVLRD
jgi:hypothetical protein